MAQGITTQPDADVALLRRIVTSRERMRARLLQRELAVELASMVGFLAVATFMAAYFEVDRTFDAALAATLVGAYAVATRAEFQVGTTWTDPSQLVFVPMLFVLPTQAVPLLVAAAMILSRVPEYARGGVHAIRVVVEDRRLVVHGLPGCGAARARRDQSDLGRLARVRRGARGADRRGCPPQQRRVTLGTGDRLGDVLGEVRAVYLPDLLLFTGGPRGGGGGHRHPLGRASSCCRWLRCSRCSAASGRRASRARARWATPTAAPRTSSERCSRPPTSTRASIQRSVVVLAHQVGLSLGIDEHGLREIEFGALLHDVGKIAVPNDVLNKPGALDDAEWELMRRHTVEGERMLDQIGGVLGDVGPVVRAHHDASTDPVTPTAPPATRSRSRRA